MSIFLERKSIRNYDQNYKISRSDLEDLLLTAGRAPSSMNLQPTKFIVIESREAKEKIRPTLYGNQLQLDTASALILIVTDLNKFANGIDIFNQSEKLGLMPSDVANRQRKIINERLKNHTNDQIIKEGILDAGLASMQLMLAAKEKGFDTCPIAGFNKETILNALNINNDNLMPVLLISIGKAKEAGFPSYRHPISKTTKFI